jgi:PilZ domain
MAQRLTREELLALALGVLPPPPFQIEVLSEDGGGFLLAIFAREGELLHAFGPREAVRKDLHLLARITDEARGRYELEFEVVDAFFHSGTDTLVHVAVSGVRHRKMRRAAPRIGVAEPATARVVFCRTLPRDSEVAVRLADISTTGLAFSAATRLDIGDLLSVTTRLAGHPAEMEVRVIRTDPAPYDRYRIGCEITEVDEPTRAVIAQLAEVAESGSEAERRPHGREESEARARLRAQRAGLGDRLPPG